jgi:hypothetical protein
MRNPGESPQPESNIAQGAARPPGPWGRNKGPDVLPRMPPQLANYTAISRHQVIALRPCWHAGARPPLVERRGRHGRHRGKIRRFRGAGSRGRDGGPGRWGGLIAAQFPSPSLI